MKRTLNRTFGITTAAVVSLGLAACGSSSSSSSSSPATSGSASSATQTASTASSASHTSSAMPAAAIEATLTAENHAPVATKPWPYTVTARSSTGKPLTGTVRIQFLFDGEVVGTDKPPVHPLKNGRWHDYLEFPREAVGHPITFQAVIHTPEGSATRNWPVMVKP